MLTHYPSMFDKKDEDKPSGIGRFLCADVEAVGLLNDLRYNDPTCVHVIHIEDMHTGEQFQFFDPYDKRDPENREYLESEDTQDGFLQDALDMIMDCESLVMQNYVGYDGLLFEKVFPHYWKYNALERRGKNREHSDYFPCKLLDTMIISQLLNPDRRPPSQAYAIGRGNVGAHSIESHGIRIGRWKPENSDWSVLTDSMLHRCAEDVGIGKDYFFWLFNNEWADHLRRGRNPISGLGIDSAYRMELQVAIDIARQGQRGWRLNMQAAWDEWLAIGEEMTEVAAKIIPFIPLRMASEPFKTDRILKSCGAYCKAFPNKDITWLRNHLQNFMVNNPEGRVGKRQTVWAITTKKGDYNAAVRKDYPEMVGNINDTIDPYVVGSYSPIVWDDVGLGNLAYIKQHVLYPRGWAGVTFGEADEKWINNTGENPSGEPPEPWSGKIDEKSLEAWRLRQEDVPEWLSGIVDWYVLRSRRSQLLNVKDMEYHAQHGEFPKQKSGGRFCKGLLAKARSKEHGMEAWQYYLNMGEYPTDEDEDWRVPAEAFSLGTNTFRMRHKFVVNIPSRGLHPLRHLFIASKGKLILGCDGAGLELRMLAHFMNDLDYTNTVLNGDIHTYNQTLAGLPIRDMAKTFIYAFLYGSGIKNLAKVCGMTEDEMARKIAQFKRELPALATLIINCGKSAEKHGYLQAIDGRWGRIRKSGGKLLIHTVLNVLLQMTGSLSMKYARCMASNQMLKEGVGLDDDGYVAFLADVHDEHQMEVNEEEVGLMSYTVEGKAGWKVDEKRQHIDSEGQIWSAPDVIEKTSDTEWVIGRKFHRAGHILANNHKLAGEFLRMRIPLQGEYKIGKSWHDTH